jgi:outer membrane protein assembly factor BamB
MTAALGACGNQGSLQSGQGQIQIASTLDFGHVYLGATVQKALPMTNGGNAQLSLNALLVGSTEVTLSSPGTFVLAEGATNSLLLTLQASNVGAVQATLSITGDAKAQVQVTATVIADLTCVQSTPCNVQTFDPNQGACVGSPASDGTACNSGNACLTDQACVGGTCLGAPIDCDAGNVCTTPSCSPVEGCQYQDNSARCQGTNPCEIYYCDPIQGCLSTPASNGTPCNAIVQCVQANVCVDGQCTGVPLPDGTPCVDQKDPCATDAKCSSGICDSPTADALQPGDILWKVIADELSDGDGGEISFDAGGYPYPSPFGWRPPAAMDDLGNIYLDEWEDGGAFLVSLDVCGHERWRTTEFGQSSTGVTNGRHELGNGIVASWMENQTIIGQSQANGQLLWSFSPDQAGYDLTGFKIGDIALSQDGSFYYAGSWLTSDGDGGTVVNGLLGAVLANGQSKFIVALPGVDIGQYPGGFGYPLLVDENEDMYTVLGYGNGTSDILSYSPIGASRWTLPVDRDNLDSLSENQGVFLEPQSLTEFNSDGNVLWTNTQPPIVEGSTGHSPVVAADGTASVELFFANPDGGAGHGVIQNYDGNGNLPWSFTLSENESPVTSAVLDSNDILYFGTSMMRIFAIDAHTGAFLWEITLPSYGPMYPGVLALSPAGSLIASTTRELFSIYTGAPMASSPWPRFRGENANDSCPLPSTAAPSPSP